MNQRIALITVTACIATFAVSAPAAARQVPIDSRAAELVRQQEEKAGRLTAAGPNKAEAVLIRLEGTGLLTGFATGLYPWFGSVLGGGGVAVGGGYRTHVGGSALFNALAGWSVANYKLLDSSLAIPIADGRSHLSFRAKWIDAPDVNFYGIGNDSDEDALASYLYNPGRLSADGTFAVTRWFSIGGGGEYLDVETGPGHGAVSIEDLFTPAAVPGLGASASYGVGRAFAAIDTRNAPDNTRRGGLYRVEWSGYASQTSGMDSLRQIEIDLRQFVPLARENWIIALHGTAVLSDTDAGAEIPYFMLPYLGSGSTLRGYATRRFVDRNTLLLQGELRWTPSRFVDMAVFVDSGKVAAERGDLDFSGLHTDGGIGIRFHGPKFSIFRFDVAKGSEGLRLVWATTLF